MKLEIEAVSKYDYAQHGVLRQNFYGVCLNVSGLIFSEVFSADGRLIQSYNGNGEEAKPSLSLARPGTLHRFEYNANRENWIIFLRDPAPYYMESGRDRLLMRSPVKDFPIRSREALDPSEVPHLRRLFQEIRHKAQSGLPGELAEAEILTANLLRRFIAPESGDAADTPAARFKKLIDNDPAWQNSLEELADTAGYSRDHIRLLFSQEYGITPGEYRIRQRLARIVRLISGTDLSMQEIARSAGIAHASYLNHLIRKYYQTTPRELCRRLRQQELP